MENHSAIPDNWKGCNINDVSIKIHYGYTAKANENGRGSKYLRITDIQENKVNWDTVPFCEIDDEEIEKFELKENNIVFARTGGTVGKSFLIKNDVPSKAVFASYLIRIKLSNYIDKKYIYLFFQSLNYWSQIELGKTGLKTNVNAQILSKLKLNLAPLPEQRAIVAKIEQLFSDLDNSIENFKKAQEQLKIYRQAVLKKAFEGELTRKWREEQTDLPSAEELLLQIKEEREKHNQKQQDEWKKAVKEWEDKGKEGKKPSRPKKPKELPPLSEEALKELPELPVGWCYNKLGFVTRKAVKVKNSEQDKNSDFIYLDIGGINKQTNKIISHKRYKWRDAPSRAQQIVHVGDTLFSTVRTYLKNIAIVEKEEYDQQICSSGFTVIRGFKKIIKSKFIFYLCIYEGFIQPLNKLQTGTSYPAVRDDDVFNQPVPICSKAEQYEIVCEIETRLSVCDKLEATITESMQKSEALRQSILKRAFEGELLNEKELEEARNAPDWEPADKLLERIKTEKEKPENKKSFFADTQ